MGETLWGALSFADRQNSVELGYAEFAHRRWPINPNLMGD